MRQRAKRIEEAERLSAGHFRIKCSLLPRVADLRAQAPTVATGIEPQNSHITRVGGNNPVEDLKERALAGAIGADEADEFSRWNRDVDSVERPDLYTEGFDKPLDVDGQRNYGGFGLSRRRRWYRHVPPRPPRRSVRARGR